MLKHKPERDDDSEKNHPALGPNKDAAPLARRSAADDAMLTLMKTLPIAPGGRLPGGGAQLTLP
jgi:hypothetical protein